MVLGMLYEGFGLMAGSSFMEVVQILVKVAKQPEVHGTLALVNVRCVRESGPLCCVVPRGDTEVCGSDGEGDEAVL